MAHTAVTTAVIGQLQLVGAPPSRYEIVRDSLLIAATALSGQTNPLFPGSATPDEVIAAAAVYREELLVAAIDTGETSAP